MSQVDDEMPMQSTLIMGKQDVSAIKTLSTRAMNNQSKTTKYQILYREDPASSLAEEIEHGKK